MIVLPATFVKGVVSHAGLPPAPFPEVAVSGRSNVGKSSLLNVLFGGRKALAKVSQRPGKTREINFFRIGDSYHLVDLPGYGYARVPTAVSEKWRVFVKEYLETRQQLGGIVQLVDARHGPSAQDREMIEWLAGHTVPALLVATKVDKLKSNARATALRELAKNYPGMDVVGFSSVTRVGRTEVLAWIDRAAAAWPKGLAADDHGD
ncbi:MAG: putative GTP-binding protein EngB [Gemmatimonadota bacterium]|nr:MAG: putative GTP-binding protein EngB [Gemmatimonadota bacterium]